MLGGWGRLTSSKLGFQTRDQRKSITLVLDL